MSSAERSARPAGLLSRLRNLWPRASEPDPAQARLGSTCAYFADALGQGEWQGHVLCTPAQAVIVRYVDRDTRLRFARPARGTQRLVYFMDDDLLDESVLGKLPAAYADKLRAQAGAHRGWLLQHCDEFWVSTRALALKYAALQARVVPLSPATELLRGAQAQSLRIAYHGSAAHRAEFEWLRPVLAEVLGQAPHVHFELIGDHSINRLFRQLPRTTILHPMSWPNYLAHTRSARADIGLAPLLAGGFNVGRGPVKFFDYARMGASTLASDGPVFSELVSHDNDGLLLPNDPEVWVRTLLALARDPARVQRLARAAQQRAWQQASPTSAGRASIVTPSQGDQPLCVQP